MTKISRRQFTAGAAALSVTAIGAGKASAQAYPTQDVHLICAFPPGSSADLIVRWYGERLRPIMKRNIIVENKVGAIGNVATEYTARSKPDGHTIYVHSPSGIAANMHLFKNPPVDVGAEIKVAGPINLQPTMLVVRADAPWKSVPELTEFLQKKGDKATYGTTNPLTKVMAAIYMQEKKLPAVEVNYKTSPDALNDLASGAIDCGFFDSGFAAAQERNGRTRSLAISMSQRMQSVPNLPTMTELGIPMSIIGSFGAMVPSATPKPIVDQIFKMFDQITRTEEAKKFFEITASDPWLTTQEEAQAFFLSEIKAWGGYVERAKIEKQG